jgi:hypothetical protein
MAGVDRTSIEEVVRKGAVEDNADVIRAPGRFVAHQMEDSEVSELFAAGPGERRRRTGRAHIKLVPRCSLSKRPGRHHATDEASDTTQVLGLVSGTAVRVVEPLLGTPCGRPGQATS